MFEVFVASFLGASLGIIIMKALMQRFSETPKVRFLLNDPNDYKTIRTVQWDEDIEVEFYLYEEGSDSFKQLDTKSLVWPKTEEWSNNEENAD